MAVENVFFVRNGSRYIKDFNDSEVHFTEKKEEALHFLNNAFNAVDKKFHGYYFYKELTKRINYRLLISLQKMYSTLAPIQRGEYEVFVYGTVRSIIISKTLKVIIELNDAKKQKITLACKDAMEAQIRTMKVGQKIKANGTINLAKNTVIACDLIKEQEDPRETKPEATPQTSVASKKKWALTEPQLALLQHLIDHPEQYTATTSVCQANIEVLDAYKYRTKMCTYYLAESAVSLMYIPKESWRSGLPKPDEIEKFIGVRLAYASSDNAETWNEFFRAYKLPILAKPGLYFVIDKTHKN